jgi:hypothetical protein
VQLEDLDARLAAPHQTIDGVRRRLAADDGLVAANAGVVERALEEAIEVERQDHVEVAALNEIGEAPAAARGGFIEIRLEHAGAVVGRRRAPQLVEAVLDRRPGGSR